MKQAPWIQNNKFHRKHTIFYQILIFLQNYMEIISKVMFSCVFIKCYAEKKKNIYKSTKYFQVQSVGQFLAGSKKSNFRIRSAIVFEVDLFSNN